MFFFQLLNVKIDAKGLLFLIFVKQYPYTQQASMPYSLTGLILTVQYQKYVLSVVQVLVFEVRD